MTTLNLKLSEPDTEGEYAEGKYKTEATASEAHTEKLQAEIQAAADKYFAGKKVVHLPWKETKKSDIAFFTSPKKEPHLADAKDNTLKQDSTIRHGSLVRIAGVIAA